MTDHSAAAMDRECAFGYVARRNAIRQGSAIRKLRQQMKLHVSLSAALIAAALAQASSGGFGAAVAQSTPSELSVCGWIGVKVSPMTRPVADSLGLTELTGAVFDRPEPGSPAAGAGIESGDVITAINGAPLTNAADFASTIAMMAPGSVVHFSTWRNGELMEVKLTLGSSKCPRRS